MDQKGPRPPAFDENTRCSHGPWDSKGALSLRTVTNRAHLGVAEVETSKVCQTCCAGQVFFFQKRRSEKESKKKVSWEVEGSPDETRSRNNKHRLSQAPASVHQKEGRRTDGREVGRIGADPTNGDPNRVPIVKQQTSARRNGEMRETGSEEV